jgi:AraC family transcriptional regulator of adaptative response / DNA-3-methyladenine glycosylase II
MTQSIHTLDSEQCQNARLSRDSRFDGVFFTGVKTTGIFCRPICSAVAPKEENVAYYPSAAAAIAAGFRPCLRCRPETAPRSAAWRGIEAIAAKILRTIEQGYLIDHSIPELAERMGISERYLRQLCHKYAGASPTQLELARKSLFAKQLLFDSNLSITDIAYAAGYHSVRRFNEHWQQQFHKTPSQMRRKRQAYATAARAKVDDDSRIELRINVAKNFDAESVFSFLASRIIVGCEWISKSSSQSSEDLEYRRLLNFDQAYFILAIRYSKRKSCLFVSCDPSAIAHLPKVIQLVKHVFDVDANADVILSQLKNTQEFAQQLNKREQQGKSDLRLPAAFDSFEAAMRAIVGQQVSVKAACTLLTRISERCASEKYAQLNTSFHNSHLAENPWGLKYCLPDARSILATDLTGLGLTQARIDSLKSVAAFYVAEPQVFAFDYDSQVRREKLLAIKGIGSWTVNYLEMRAYANPDAFPAGDLGVRIALQKNGIRPTEKQVRDLSRPWAPWRAYATVLLWQRLAGDNA